MNETIYLTKRRKTYFFRRRVPKLSTEYRPVMVSLGTTDHKSALKSCAMLTPHMDRMLDDDLHMTLPEADVAAFFKAELARVLRNLRVTRTAEHVDGSMTAKKAGHNHLEAIVLSWLAEDGLRNETPQARLYALDPAQRRYAAELYRDKYAEFTSSEFNENIEKRASAILDRSEFTEYDNLFLRKAAIEARMAACSALETVPVHGCTDARAAALSLLEKLMQAQMQPLEIAPTPPELPDKNVIVPSPKQSLSVITEGVELILNRVTAQTIYRQRDQALAQPKIETFDGDAQNLVTDEVYGADIFGTAVRMVRKSRSQEDTGQQKLKSVSLFIYLTGVQMVTDIRQHHLDMFCKGLETQIPKHYWKSESQKNMTFKELLEVERNKPDESKGLAPQTIARHLATIINVIRFADAEKNTAGFIPRTDGLIPIDKRSDDQKRAVFTLKDAKLIFQHPLWQGCKSKGRRHTEGPLVIKDHHYWINLLLAYTGARRSEIAGLVTIDVGHENGISFIHIRENRLRGLKTSFSKRRVPLHPHLLDLGFLEFTEASQEAGDLALFPEAIPAKIRELCLNTENPAPPFDKKFGDSLDHVWRECMVRSLDGNPEKYCVASLRSFVNDTLINLRKKDGNTLLVPDIDRRDILGHKPIDVNVGTYRRHEKPLGPLNVAIGLLPRLF